MNNLQNLEDILVDLNKSMDEIENSDIYKFDSNDLPLGLRIGMSGISSQSALNFLFSEDLNKLLDRFIDMIENGEIEKFLTDEDKLRRMFNSFGFGEGKFQGELSNMLVSNIKKTVSSNKFKKTKLGMAKLIKLTRSLKKQSKTITDPEKRKKFDDMIYAVTQMVKIIHNVWTNRKMVNDRVVKGLKNFITEDSDDDIQLIRIM